MEMNNANDFKYFLEDFSTIYIGANYTYTEVMQSEVAPLKYKEVVARVFAKERDANTTIAEHLATMKDDETSYMIYHQLKVKIKVTQLKKNGKGYESNAYSLEDYQKQYQEKTVQGECFIEEIIIKKLHLVSFAV
ncbi:MAG: hypothetical protein PHS74_09955 [Lachnospiraceae bacterium]|nr:hypothetical protein [Lachnospiraceae bacterium]